MPVDIFGTELHGFLLGTRGILGYAAILLLHKDGTKRPTNLQYKSLFTYCLFFMSPTQNLIGVTKTYLIQIDINVFQVSMLKKKWINDQYDVNYTTDIFKIFTHI